jgi:hypothetical protein
MSRSELGAGWDFASADNNISEATAHAASVRRRLSIPARSASVGDAKFVREVRQIAAYAHLIPTQERP